MSFLLRHAPLNILLLTMVALASLAAQPSFAADGNKRLALVIGNSTYQEVSPLINPANDAKDMAQKLKVLGFDVLLATDAGQATMTSLLQEFKSRLTREHVALFFFAGHGVTVNNESFLIPVDAPGEIDLDEKGAPQAESVSQHLVSMASILAPLEASKIGIVFLDACRTNAAQPEVNLRVVSLRTNRSVQILRGTGSLQIKPSPYSAGVFRAYATQLDNVASDGTGRNSPFTRALLKHIGTKGISIRQRHLQPALRREPRQQRARRLRGAPPCLPIWASASDPDCNWQVFGAAMEAANGCWATLRPRSSPAAWRIPSSR
jgi:hypothetical protein